MTGVYSNAAAQSQDSSRRTGESVTGDSERIASSDKTFDKVHQFIAKIIDAVDSNRTVLYVPEETSRLHVESIVSTWMRQIRQVLSNDWNDEQDAGKVSQSPLSSYREYWCERTANLRGILAQLGSSKIQILFDELESRKHAEYICRDVRSMSGSIEDELVRSVRVCELLGCIETPYEYFINARLTSLTNALEHLTREMWDTWRNARDERVATSELYIDLLRRVSDQIIATCKAEVQLETIFQPDLVGTEDYDTAVGTLRKCSTIAEYWEGLRESICSCGDSPADNPFIGLDIKTALSHLDAFTHRCKDLLEVCDAREQFAPPQQRSFPNANDFTRHDMDERLLAMKDVFFSGVLQRLRNVRHSALDMSSVKWHDEFAAFKTQLKALETKLCEILEQALDETSQLTTRVELLSLLYSRIARRDGVRRKVEACAAQTYALFAGELQFVKHQFDTQRQRPPIGRDNPKAFGCVRWAASLLHRLESIFGTLTLASSSGTVPQSPMLHDLVATYNLVIPQIEQFMKEKHQEWFSCASKIQVDKHLCRPVLELRDNGTVAVAMPLDLQVAHKNAEGFISISMDVPKGLLDLTRPDFAKTLKKMYESLASVVDRSDALLCDIQAAPRGSNLFQENVEILRGLFQAASIELTWQSDLDVVLSFCAEVDDFCAFLGKQLSDFTDTNAKISQACKLLDTLIRPKVRTESLKTIHDFDSEYREQFRELKAQINSLLDTIVALLRDRQEVMCSSTAALSAWTQYAGDVQISIEKGLKKLFIQLIGELNNNYGEDNLFATRQQPFLVVRADLLQTGESEYVICTNPALVEMMDVLRRHFDETVDYFSRQMSSSITDSSVQFSLCEKSMREMSGIIARVQSNINAGLGKILGDTDALMQHYRSQYDYLWASTFDESP
jgi:dynein heavy chain